jgi:hypothetical protein
LACRILTTVATSCSVPTVTIAPGVGASYSLHLGATELFVEIDAPGDRVGIAPLRFVEIDARIDRRGAKSSRIVEGTAAAPKICATHAKTKGKETILETKGVMKEGSEEREAKKLLGQRKLKLYIQASEPQGTFLG